MNQTPYTPDSLADELDRRLPDQMAGSADPLIAAAARFSAAPRPTLAPEARARIRAAMLDATPGNPSPLRRFQWQPLPVRLILAAALLLLIAGTVWAAQHALPLFQPPSPTHVSPTAIPAQVVPATIQPTAIAEPTRPASITVEGPVQSIDGSRVVIFGLTVVLNPTDPLLEALQVGDVLRVEGAVAADPTVITALQTTVVNIEIDVNPANDQQVWRDPGDCSHPPPSWAPANGWRRRCQGAPGSGNSDGQGKEEDD